MSCRDHRAMMGALVWASLVGADAHADVKVLAGKALFGVNAGCSESLDVPPPLDQKDIFYEEVDLLQQASGSTSNWHGWGNVSWLHATGVSAHIKASGWSQEKFNGLCPGGSAGPWQYEQGHGEVSLDLSLTEPCAYDAVFTGSVSGIPAGSGVLLPGTYTLSGKTIGNSSFSLVLDLAPVSTALTFLQVDDADPKNPRVSFLVAGTQGGGLTNVAWSFDDDWHSLGSLPDGEHSFVIPALFSSPPGPHAIRVSGMNGSAMVSDSCLVSTSQRGAQVEKATWPIYVLIQGIGWKALSADLSLDVYECVWSLPGGTWNRYVREAGLFLHSSLPKQGKTHAATASIQVGSAVGSFVPVFALYDTQSLAWKAAYGGTNCQGYSGNLCIDAFAVAGQTPCGLQVFGSTTAAGGTAPWVFLRQPPSAGWMAFEIQ